MLSSACISATRGAVKHGRQQRGGGRHSHRTPLQLPPLPRVDDGSQQAAAVHHLHGKEHQRPLRAMCVCACSARRAVARSSHQQLEQHPPPALPPPPHPAPSAQAPQHPAPQHPTPQSPPPNLRTLVATPCSGTMRSWLQWRIREASLQTAEASATSTTCTHRPPARSPTQ